MSAVKYIFLKILLTQWVSANDEYEYDDSAIWQVARGGNRLVGASRADHKTIPFLVGFNSNDSRPEAFASCTGSLITPMWVLSAAHCVVATVPMDEIQSCLLGSKSLGSYITKSSGGIVRCQLDLHKNVKIYLLNPGGAVYFGISDLTDISDVKLGKQTKMEYFIRHYKSYRGGGSYGKYGGIDITLLRLKKPAEAIYTPACVPTPAFPDSGRKASLAGYGKYYRESCQTDEYGPSKYHYCNSTCNKASEPPQPALCKQFFNSAEGRALGKFQDIVLSKYGHRITYCYASKSPEVTSAGRGWCYVTTDASKIGEVTEDESWGFCGKDCKLEGEPDIDVLRKVDDIDILNDRLCEKFLEKALNDDVEVRPQILCIGRVAKINIKAFKVTAYGFLKVNPSGMHHKMEAIPGSHIYVHSVGTCNGDSGGPVYVESKETGKFVVLGAVSGGRGKLADCGGINNPTHYIRVKKLVKWLIQTLGKDAADLCFSNK